MKRPAGLLLVFSLVMASGWFPTQIGRRLSPSGDVYPQLSSDQRHALLHYLQFTGPGFEIEDLTDSAERDAKALLKKTDTGWKVVNK